MYDIEEFDNFFSKRISQLRIAKDVSARDMSLTIGQSAGYINTIENKKALPSMHVFYYICEYLTYHQKSFLTMTIPLLTF